MRRVDAAVGRALGSQDEGGVLDAGFAAAAGRDRSLPTEAEMEPRLLRLSDLATRDLSLQWHEAVAIVQEVVEAIGRAGADAGVPEPDEVAIDPDGRARLLATRAGSPADSVRDLSRLLQVLLEGASVPPELRLLISRNTFERPAHPRVAELSQALSFFERPNRRGVVAAVAARFDDAPLAAGPPPPSPPPAASFATPPADAADTPVSDGRRRRRRRRLVAASAALLVGATVVACGYWLLSPPGPESSPASLEVPATPRAQEAVRTVVRSGLAAMGIVVGETPPTADAAPSPVRDARAPAATGRVRPEPPGPANAALPTSRPPAVALETPAAPTPAPPVAVTPSRSAEVYLEGDPSVAPAVLVRPQLPSAPAREAVDQVGVLDIVVSESGTVERVRLISPANRYHERMIVSAAKAWRFEPATRDGQPVKYRTRVNISY